MTLIEIRRHFPRTGQLIGRLLDEQRVFPSNLERLSWYALERIESGETPERDAVLLLTALSRAKLQHRKDQK